MYFFLKYKFKLMELIELSEGINIEYIDNCFKVINRSGLDIITSYIDFKRNYALRVDIPLKNSGWSSINMDDCQGDDLILTIRYNKKIHFIRANKNKHKIEILNSDYKIDLNTLKNEPIIITGHAGGGTSVVVKLLRYMGLFAGKDSGDITIRKPHESLYFRELNHIIKNNIKCVNNTPNKIYFGDDFDKNSIWGFKTFINETSLDWIKIFPDAKFLSVIRHPNKNNYHTTSEGSKFNNSSELEVLKKQKPSLKGQRCFHIDYKQFFDNYKYTNEVLEYCGLRTFSSQEEFEKILNIINFTR